MRKILLISLVVVSFLQAKELNLAMQEYLNLLEKEAKQENPNFKKFDFDRGKVVFTTKRIGKNDTPISCVTCHTSDLTKKGVNERTNKVIEPLSPNTNPSRLSDVKEVKKWLRRNFKDVYNREGTSQEKGDVIIYIINASNKGIL